MFLHIKILEWPGDKAIGCPGVPSGYKRFESCGNPVQSILFGFWDIAMDLNSADSDTAYNISDQECNLGSFRRSIDQSH